MRQQAITKLKPQALNPSKTAERKSANFARSIIFIGSALLAATATIDTNAQESRKSRSAKQILIAQTSEDPILIGYICVVGNKSITPHLIFTITNAGGKAAMAPAGDVHCHDGNLPHALKVPDGLEGWSVGKLRQAGFPAGFAGGTAGGSGDIRLAFDPRRALAQEISPSTIEELKTDLQCRLSMILKPRFADVSFSRCTESMSRDGFCWWIWLGGHTSTSTTFKSPDLSAKISDKYWFSAKLQIWMGYFPHSPFEPQDGPKLKVHFYVVSSKFARFPPSTKPETDSYKHIDHFHKGVSPDAIDDAINNRIEEFIKAFPVKCEEAQR